MRWRANEWLSWVNEKFHVNHNGERHTVAKPGFAETPQPPYYIVAFSSQRAAGDHGYGNMASEMERLALEQDGCIGMESVRGADGFGITNAYWRDEASIMAWKNNVRHLAAQKLGRARWYEHYQVRIGRVERAYGFDSGDGGK